MWTTVGPEFKPTRTARGVISINEALAILMTS